MPEAHDVNIKPAVWVAVAVARAAERLAVKVDEADSWVRATLPFFWHKIRLSKTAPRHHRYETHEYEYPYRHADSHVLRVIRNFGVVVGRWHGGQMEEESPEFEAHLNGALHGRTLTTNEEYYRKLGELTYAVLDNVPGRNRLVAVGHPADGIMSPELSNP